MWLIIPALHLGLGEDSGAPVAVDKAHTGGYVQAFRRTYLHQAVAVFSWCRGDAVRPSNHCIRRLDWTKFEQRT